MDWDSARRPCGGNAPYRRIFKSSSSSFRFLEICKTWPSTRFSLERLAPANSYGIRWSSTGRRCRRTDYWSFLTWKWKWCLERCELFIETAIKPSSPHWLQSKDALAALKKRDVLLPKRKSKIRWRGSENPSSTQVESGNGYRFSEVCYQMRHQRQRQLASWLTSIHLWTSVAHGTLIRKRRSTKSSGATQTGLWTFIL